MHHRHSFWPNACLGSLAPQSSPCLQHQRAETAPFSYSPAPAFTAAQLRMVSSGAANTHPMQHTSNQHAPSSLPLAWEAIGTVSIPDMCHTAASLSEAQHVTQYSSPAGADLAMHAHAGPQQDNEAHTEAHEHAAVQRARASSAQLPLSYLELSTASPAAQAQANRPRASSQPSAQQDMGGQRSVFNSSSRSVTLAGVVRPGTSPQQRPAQHDEAVQKGVLQSGSSEELARQLADLTQFVSCARSDRGQDVCSGVPCPAGTSQPHAFPPHAPAGQQLTHQAPPVPKQHHVSPSQVHAGHPLFQHRELGQGPDGRSSIGQPFPQSTSAQQSTGVIGKHVHSAGLLAGQRCHVADTQRSPLHSMQKTALAQRRAPCQDRHASQQCAVPVASQQLHSGHQHEAKRRRGSPEICRGSHQRNTPSDLQEDSAPPVKRAKLDGIPLHREYNAARSAVTQTRATEIGHHTRHSIAADISLSANLRPAAGAHSLHAILRCVSFQMLPNKAIPIDPFMATPPIAETKAGEARGLQSAFMCCKADSIHIAGCRGDAAPSTSTEMSKGGSNEMHLAQQRVSPTDKPLPSTAVPSQLPFAFQQSTPGVQGPQTEQLTPVLPHKQQLMPAQEMPADRLRPTEYREQTELKSARLAACSQPGTPAAQGQHSLAETAQQNGSVPMQISLLLITPPGPPNEGCLPGRDFAAQRWGPGSPVMRGKSDSHSKHSKSSSEEQQGSRLGGGAAVGMIRSATAPPQLLIESQRGSNSPKKPVPRCSAQAGACSTHPQSDFEQQSHVSTIVCLAHQGLHRFACDVVQQGPSSHAHFDDIMQLS